ncbi:MAG TPA: cysteine desulfurase family protein [Candidatus Krumholzibacteriaceae bacterium]|nr:cysteine desulfurase family protein [Candidatus Krumholzibacteriaceae bacterium]
MKRQKSSKKSVYLDHNATTYARGEVVSAMEPYFTEKFANPSSLHFLGRENREAVERARKEVGSFINAGEREIIFTSGGTESNNLAVRGALRALERPLSKCHIITSTIEHPAVQNTFISLERDGAEVDRVECDSSGVVKIEMLEDLIRPDTVLVSIMTANNETGIIQPLKEIASRLSGRGIILHSDAVQCVGKIDVDVEILGVDLLSISAHKFYGPKGTGALYIRKGISIEPVYTGAAHEFSLRPGTENVPSIVGLGRACDISKAMLDGEIDRIGRLRDRMEEILLKKIPDIRIIGKNTARVPNTSSIILYGVDGEAAVLNLSALGFCISSGSACSSGKSGASAVLKAMGLEAELAKSVIRVSLGIRNTGSDIESFALALAGVVKRLREISPSGS